jgi:hypothetical protein
MIDLDAATKFIWISARLIDRHRFAHLFRDAPADAVVAAVRPYQNSDGGFGNGLEPDLRTPTSQPIAVNSALEALDEAGAFDDPMVAAACDWLVTVQREDGGVPFVLPSAAPHPRAPWWQTEEDPGSSTTVTGLIASHLERHGYEHPWLEAAREFMRSQVESSPLASPYEARAVLAYLDATGDEAAVDALAPRLREAGIVELDPDAAGEVHFPIDYAPWPDRPSRRIFDPELIERHLDALAARQQNDGGWRFNWTAWAPGPEAEWRGFVTIHALKVLRANGRL